MHHLAGFRRGHFDFHLHGLQHRHHLAFFHAVAFGHGELPDVAGSGGFHRSAFRQAVRFLGVQVLLGFEVDLAACHPALQFLVEGPVAGVGEGADVGVVVFQEALVLAQVEGGLLDPERIAALGEVAADPLQLLGTHFIEADLVEEAQQPGLGERLGAVEAVPHLHGAAHELVAAGAFHAVHAQIGAADAHRVFRGPGAGRVVLGGHQPVARVVGGGHRRAQVDVAQAHHHIAGVEQDLLHLVDAVQAVDAADELDVAGAPGGVLAHRLHVFLDRQAAGFVVPAQRQVDDARGHFQVVLLVQGQLGPFEHFEQIPARQHGRLEVHLQGADARSQLENAVGFFLFQPQHQRVGAEPQPQVQLQRAVFHQQVAVAGGAVDHLRAVFLFFQPVQDRRGDRRRRRGKRRRAQAGQAGVLFRRQAVGVLQAQRHEAQAVAGLELAQFPAVRRDHRGGAHEAAQRRPVRPQDHRHVAGEVHRAHGVGVVVNVGRVHARFAAVAARPLRLRAHQADAGAAGVVVHLPVGAEEGGHVVVGEKVRRAVGAVNHAQLPGVAQRRFQAVGHRHRGRVRRLGAEMQHVAGADGAPAVAAELPQGEGAARAQVGLALQAAGEGQVGAGAVAAHLAQLEGLAGGDGNRLVVGHRLAVQGGAHVGAGEGDAGAVVEAQGGAVEGELQAGGVLVVAQQAVAEPEAERVEGAGRRHADRPVAAPARVVLHRGQGAAGEHVQGGGVVVEIVQVAGGHFAVLERPVGEDRQHIVAVGFDALHAGVFQGALQGGQRRFAVVFKNDQLGQHRVVKR